MTQDQINTKIEDLKKSVVQLVNASRQEIARKQQELQEYIKSAQKGIDNLEGRIAAYQEMLAAKPKEAGLEDAIVVESESIPAS